MKTKQNAPRRSKAVVRVDTNKGERPWTSHLFVMDDGNTYKFLSKERKDGRLDVTEVWETPTQPGFGGKVGPFTVSKDEYDRMIEDLAKGIFKGGRHEVFYPQKMFGPEADSGDKGED